MRKKWYLEYKKDGEELWCIVEAEKEDCVKRICLNAGVEFIKAKELKGKGKN